MPLQLGGVETERAQIVSFDESCPQQASEASKEVVRLMASGFRRDYSHDSPGEVRLTPPPRPEGMSVMRILSENGDDRLTWDRNDPNQIKEAYKQFRNFLKKGYQAFSVMATGKKGHKLDDFDPLAEEILMVPATVPG
jgi:hypothetical protein